MGKMNKNENTSLLAWFLGLAALTGTECTVLNCIDRLQYSDEPKSYFETIDENNLDLFNDNSYRIIQVENVLNEKNIYFAKKVDLGEITYSHIFSASDVWYKYTEGESYEKYFSGKSFIDDYIYLDLITKEPIIVEYVSKEMNVEFVNGKVRVYRDKDETSTYKMGNIISNADAYEYAYLYLGEQDTYTLEDMNFVIEKLRNSDTYKTKKLTK